MGSALCSTRLSRKPPRQRYVGRLPGRDLHSLLAVAQRRRQAQGIICSIALFYRQEASLVTPSSFARRESTLEDLPRHQGPGIPKARVLAEFRHILPDP